MARNRAVPSVRRLVAGASGMALATASLVGVGIGPGVTPAAATHGDGHYVASASPLSHDGVDFSDQPEDFPPVPPGSGAVWFAADSLVWAGEDGNTVVPFGPEPVGFDGGSDVDVALVHELDLLDGEVIGDITVYLDAALLDTRDCEGVLGIIDEDEVGDVECVAFKPSILVAHGAGADYTFGDFDGFIDADGAPLAEPPAVVDGFTDPPSLTFLSDDGGGENGGGNGGGSEDPYLASRSPLTWNGTDYPAMRVLTQDDGGGGVPVNEDDTPIPNADGTRGYHVALALIDGTRFTYLFDSGFPLPTDDCDGFQLFLDSMGPGHACENFKADYLVAQGAGEPYVFDGFGGFESPGEVAVMAGFTTPPSLQIGGGDGGGGEAPLHGEGHESEYEASRSVLELDGTLFGDVWPSAGPNPGPFVLYVTSAPDHYGNLPYRTTIGGIGPEDHFRPSGVPGDDNFQPFHVALVTVEGEIPQQGGGSQSVTRHSTIFLDDGVFAFHPNEDERFSTDCPGFEAFAEEHATFGAADDQLDPPTVECVAFHSDVLTPNGPGQDFTFQGFSAWTDGEGNPLNSPAVAEGSPDPRLDFHPWIRWFASSVSPWTFEGIDFTDRMWEPSVDPDRVGTNFGTAIPDGNEYLFADGQRPRGIPSFGGLNDFGVALLEIDGRFATFWWENVLGSALGIVDCPSMVEHLEDWVDVVTAGEGGVDVACHAFSDGAFLLAPESYCEDYTYVEGTWTDATGDPIPTGNGPQLTANFEDTPSLAWVGPDSVCAQQEPPPENPPGGSGPAPGSENPGTSTGDPDPAAGEPGHGDAPDGDARHGDVDPTPPVSGTLPRTGSDVGHLLVVALALLLAGTALVGGGGRRRPGFSAR